jgi:MoaA/NifB/PqqE/SkfB family radical SAM enzyme
LEKASRIIKEAVAMGLETLSLTGGEPLIHPRIVEIVQLAHSLDVKDIRVFTSGIKSKNSRAAPMESADAKSLADAGLRRVFFNLEGASVETHEIVTRTTGSFEAVMSGCIVCKERGMYVGFHFVPMKLNWREILGIASIARNLKVDEIGILRFVPQGRGTSNRDMLEMGEREFRDLLLLTSELMEAFDRPKIRLGCPFNSISELMPTWEMKRCPAARDMCHVLIDGTVAPCSAFKHDGAMKSANAYIQPLREIWRTGFSTFIAERARLAAEYECTAQALRTTNKAMPLARIPACPSVQRM